MNFIDSRECQLLRLHFVDVCLNNVLSISKNASRRAVVCFKRSGSHKLHATLPYNYHNVLIHSLAELLRRRRIAPMT